MFVAAYSSRTSLQSYQKCIIVLDKIVSEPRSIEEAEVDRVEVISSENCKFGNVAGTSKYVRHL